MPPPAECLAPNPDVSGIGIRISFYISTMVIAAVPRREPFNKLLAPLETNNGLNGLALLITAVAQSASASSGSLSLYHAIIVLHMLTFLGIATSTAGEYSSNQTRFRVLAVTSWCSMIVFFYLVLRVWITAPTFGSQPECNDWTVYVLMGVSVRATSSWLRWLIVALVCLTLLNFLINTTKMVASLGLSTSRRRNRSNTSIDSRSTEGPGFITRCLPCTSTMRRTPGLILRVFASIYSVIMLELTIRRNLSSDQEKVWSFGQIIALLITLMTVNEVVHFILGEYQIRGISERVDGLFPAALDRGRSTTSIKSGQQEEDRGDVELGVGNGNPPLPLEG